MHTLPQPPKNFSILIVRDISIAVSGMIGLAVAMGIGRFAYTPLLPFMIGEHLVSVSVGSMLASINLAGYLIGAITGIAARTHHRALAIFGLALTFLCTLAMGLTENIYAWFVLRALAGIASAWALVGITNWSIQHLTLRECLRYRGIVFSGPGVGIAFSGLSVTTLYANGMLTSKIWISLGIAALILSILVVLQIFTTKEDGGPTSLFDRTRHPHTLLLPKFILTAAYGLAGYGYINTTTFLPLITRELLEKSATETLLWPVLGISSIFATIIFGFSHSRHNTRLLITAYAIQSIGVLAPAIMHSLNGLAISSILVGATFMLIVMLTMHEAKSRYADPSLVALLTASYALGQMIGPYSAGLIYQSTHSFLPALEISGAGLLVAAVLTYLERSIWERRMTNSETHQKINEATNI